MRERWNYSELGQVQYGDVESYRLAAEWLDVPMEIVEDWGCGCAFSKRFFSSGRYRGIDGSHNNYADVCGVDLATFSSNPDNLLMRHVLDHNEDWKPILQNALSSFKHRMVLIFFREFGPTTKVVCRSRDPKYPGVPDLQFNREEIMQFIAPYLVREHFIPGAHGISETLFFLEKPKRRGCIATYATQSFDLLCQITDPQKQAYAQRHGYSFERNPDRSEGPDRHPFFDRHRWHLSLMNSGKWDWFYFVDADAIITNRSMRLGDFIRPGDHLVFPLDAIMIQAGGFLANNTDISIKFLTDLLAREDRNNPTQSDQIEMEVLLPLFGTSIRLLPQRMLGSYDYHHYKNLGGNYLTAKDRNGNDGQWHRGDFIFHCPGMELGKKINVLRQKINEIV